MGIVPGTVPPRMEDLMGSLYLRGKTWWMKMYVDGRPVQKSTGTTKKMVAKEVLKAAERQLEDEKVPGYVRTDYKYEDMEALFLQDYRVNGRKSLSRALISAGHLREYFGGRLIKEITSKDLQGYIGSRIDAGVANSTINRELSALKRMFSIGSEQTPPMVFSPPKINILKEPKARAGFFGHSEFCSVRAALPPHLRPVVTFAYKTGWRIGEVVGLMWSHVDRVNWCARVDDTKNGDSRVVYFGPELVDLFSALWAGRKEKQAFCAYVFLSGDGRGRIKRFDKTWKAACKKAGVDRLFHDLRRTAVRNMVRAGVPESVAMRISGHKTRSVFERYNITNDQDLRNAAAKVEAYLDGQKSMVTHLATVRAKTAKAV